MWEKKETDRRNDQASMQTIHCCLWMKSSSMRRLLCVVVIHVVPSHLSNQLIASCKRRVSVTP